MWQEKCDNFKQVHTRKDEEILELNRRLSECDIELTKLIHERDMKRVNYDDMLRLQQDNQRLAWGITGRGEHAGITARG